MNIVVVWCAFGCRWQTLQLTFPKNVVEGGATQKAPVRKCRTKTLNQAQPLAERSARRCIDQSGHCIFLVDYFVTWTICTVYLTIIALKDKIISSMITLSSRIHPHNIKAPFHYAVGAQMLFVSWHHIRRDLAHFSFVLHEIRKLSHIAFKYIF